MNSFAAPQVQPNHELELEEAAVLRPASYSGVPMLRRLSPTIRTAQGYEASPGAVRNDQERRRQEVETSRGRQAGICDAAPPVTRRAEQNQSVEDHRALMPNPSLNHRTRYGKRRKPGPRHLVHHREPGLRRVPPQAG